MADPVPFDEHAERLKIRSSPRPVAKINRKLLMAGAAAGALLLFAAASIALKPPRAVDPGDRQELYNIANTRKPEGLSSLPTSYSDMKRDVPRLGPPLAGDLGATVLQAERDLGVEPEYAERFDDDFRPNPEDEAERARRMRLAALEDEAARAPVFFRLQSETADQPRGGRSAEREALDGIGAELTALAGLQQRAMTGGNASADPNLQDRKQAFAGERPDAAIYNPHSVEDPVSPFLVMAGTLIPASLITAINSDLPGTIIAQVSQPVYDTVTGGYLLIPQGTRLIGRYQSEVSFGQDRALIVWDRMIFPDGTSVVISEPGADARGYAGVADRTDHHWGRAFAAAGLATILGIGAELGSGDDSDIERAIRRGTSDTVNQAGQRVVERNLGVQPTIRVRPGWPVRVIVTRDLVLRPH
ncbi:TrbI/VirB10 family protein [Hyphococcus luteus]|uniref:Conjugal transfer protein TrbI n=1 Tax=Hyphococcus luteus TaxID=2058213 RepID=A0A2S7KB43_9PROT|nr:TrbI/VirB10 family protein [Marinicaulis flavus]PQA89668.1 conjugal transfer protein TrbI [Marinicaulis flavus]